MINIKGSITTQIAKIADQVSSTEQCITAP